MVWRKQPEGLKSAVLPLQTGGRNHRCGQGARLGDAPLRLICRGGRPVTEARRRSRAGRSPPFLRIQPVCGPGMVGYWLSASADAAHASAGSGGMPSDTPQWSNLEPTRP